MTQYEINGHYSRCDVCGEGWDRIRVNIPAVSAAEPQWTCGYKSPCHGEKEITTADVAEVIAFLDEYDWLLATRAARREMESVRYRITSWEDRRARHLAGPRPQREERFDDSALAGDGLVEIREEPMQVTLSFTEALRNATATMGTFTTTVTSNTNVWAPLAG